jgi:NAD(P)-dependent dehydrogenase (short-subunit alcohol dehydrogenase family)
MNEMTQDEAVDAALFDLTGRRALVTGASRGIGRAIALGFAARGAEVLVVARGQEGLDDTVRLAGDSPGNAVAHAADLRDHAAVEASVAAAVDTFGGLDILVNNAGDDHDAPIEEMDREIFERIMALNVEAYWTFAKAAAPHLVDGGGKVINVASMLGVVAVREGTAYIASKHAVVGLTRALAVEWGRRDVQVNALAPGFVETEFTRSVQENEALSKWVRRGTPMGRMAQPEEMIGPAVFLASCASGFMTGQVLVVDGGWTAQ